MPTNTAPLTVYKASAGSGKTFTLAVEYIRLLVADPMNYCYTLAVTFTNKATQEMKLRILSKLYGIANSLPDADDYYKKVKKSFPNLTERVIRNRAGDALSLLVHDYSRFRVETIDSFFQRVLRNLARELGLTACLKVMLNDKEVESQAVDNIISNVDNGKDPLLTWIMDFISERMEEDKNWNVVANIKDFGQNIFSDFYKSHQGQLRLIMDDADFFKRYTSRLRALRAKALDEMADFAKRYDAIASEYGIDDSCYSRGHSNAPGYFENLAKGILVSDKPKMPNSYVLAGLEDPDKFVKKADVGKPVSIAIREHVKPLIEEAEEKREAAAVTVNSVTLTLQNINQLRLLGRIETEVNRINADNNDYPLSNTQKLLNDLIDKQDSPFIYEKIGGQLRYIMIRSEERRVGKECRRVLFRSCNGPISRCFSTTAFPIRLAALSWATSSRAYIVGAMATGSCCRGLTRPTIPARCMWRALTPITVRSATLSISTTVSSKPPSRPFPSTRP